MRKSFVSFLIATVVCAPCIAAMSITLQSPVGSWAMPYPKIIDPGNSVGFSGQVSWGMGDTRPNHVTAGFFDETAWSWIASGDESVLTSTYPGTHSYSVTVTCSSVGTWLLKAIAWVNSREAPWAEDSTGYGNVGDPAGGGGA